MLGKESIVIMKKSDYETLTYLYVLWYSKLIYTAFTVYVCVCVRVNEHSKI